MESKVGARPDSNQVCVDRRKREVKFVEQVTGQKVEYGMNSRDELGGPVIVYYSGDGQKLGSSRDMHDSSKSHGDIDPVVGFVVPRKQQTAIKYLDEAREYNDQNATINKQMELSNKLYLNEGVIGTAIDILVEFAVTEPYWENVDNQNALEILNQWKDYLNYGKPNIVQGIEGLSREMALDWFICGNVFPFVSWSSKAGRQFKLRRDNVSLPDSISLLNPLAVEIPDGPVEFGQKVIFLKLSDKVRDAIKYKGNDDIELKIIRDNMSQELINSIIKSKDDKLFIPIDPRYVCHLRRKGRSYQPYGVPYLTRSFGAVAHKRKLKALDDATTDGLINKITVFKIGDKDNPKTWKPERIRAFARLLSSPTATMYLVWAYDIDKIEVGPSGDVLNFDKKYENANRDILEALGVPTTLILGAQGGNLQDIWVTVLALLERLEDFRKNAAIYFSNIGREIMINNGFGNIYPKLEYGPVMLRNEEKVKDLILKLYDRGLLSFKTAIRDAGYSYEKELKIRREEAKEELDKVFMRRDLPYSPAKNKQELNSPEDGRPSDSSDDGVK